MSGQGAPPRPPPGPPPRAPPKFSPNLHAAGPTETSSTLPTADTRPPALPPIPGTDAPVRDEAEERRTHARDRIALFQQLEIDRILGAFKLNPYDVLEIPLEADDKEINKIFRKKSLLIHPDKVRHERAVEAFDLLKKASSHLLDEDKRKALDETVMDARLMVLKELNLPFSTASDDPRTINLTPSWEERIRKATKELMVDDELRRRKAIRIQHQSEGEAQRKKEEAIAERKRKAEQDTVWESTRDHRVADWRSFQKGAKKKRKDDANVLG